MRILVVEDDPVTAQGLVCLLGSTHEVAWAPDGRAALEKVGRGYAPDVVVTDYSMPVLDGEGLLQALRGDPLHAAVPAVVMTAVRRELVDQLQERFPGLVVLRKPFDLSVLMGVLHGLGVGTVPAQPDAARHVEDAEP